MIAARWNRRDIMSAWSRLESDYNVGGWLRARPSNVRRNEACSVQLRRVGFDCLHERMTRNAWAIYRNAEARLGFRPVRTRHVECKPGAAVRLHGYMPARVVMIEHEHSGPDYSRATVYAHCRVTVRSAGIGPHGYRPGDTVRVRASDAVPRDLIRVRRGSGRLYWPAFTVRT